MQAKDLIKQIKKHCGKGEYEIDLAETLRLVAIIFKHADYTPDKITETFRNHPNLPGVPSIMEEVETF